MNLPPIMTHDGRRAWAFTAIVGGAMVFTVFAAVGVWLVRNHANFAFYLALAAHAQILVSMTALAALFVKRNLSIGKDGVTISDNAVQDAANQVAAAAVDEAEAIKGT